MEEIVINRETVSEELKTNMQNALGKLEKISIIISFFAFGIVYLMPWSSVSNVIIYLQDRLNSTPKLKGYFIPCSSAISMCSTMIGGLINLFYFSRINPSFRKFFVFGIMLFAFAFCLILVKLKAAGAVFFWMFMLIASMMNVFCNVQLSASFDIAGYYDPKCFGALNGGISFSSVLVAIISIITTFVGSSNQTVAFIFLSINFSIIFLTFLAFLRIYKSKFYQDQANSSVYQREKYLDVKSHIKNISKRFYQLFFKFKFTCLSTFITLAITLFIFPTLIVHIKPNNIFISNTYLFSSFQCFLTYGVGELIGRYTYIFIKWPKKDSMSLLILSISRILFIPLFMLCNMTNFQKLPCVFKHDFFAFLMTFLFAMTCGHILTIVFSTPYSLEDKKDQVDLSALNVSLIGTGVTFGSIFSLSLAT